METSVDPATTHIQEDHHQQPRPLQQRLSISDLRKQTEIAEKARRSAVQSPPIPGQAQMQPPVISERRGRQYQIPKRYDFQRNIPNSRDSSEVPSQQPQHQQHQQHQQQAAPPFFSPNFSVTRPKRRDDSTKSNSGASRTSHDNLAQLKRHSVSTVVGGELGGNLNNNNKHHIMNTYNDTKVFDTIAPAKRHSINYILDNISVTSLPSTNYSPQLAATTTLDSQVSAIQNVNSNTSNQIQNAPLNNNSNNYMKRKSISIVKPVPQDQSNLPTFNSSISKINYYQNAEADLHHYIIRHRRTSMSDTNSNSNRSSKSGTKRIPSIATDNSVSMKPKSQLYHSNVNSDNDEDSSSSSDIENGDTESANRETVDTLPLPSYLNSAQLVDNEESTIPTTNQVISSIPMRTQQRQLVIKDLTSERNVTGNAWFEFANNTKRLEGSIESLVEDDNIKKSNVWVRVSIEQRNKYEQISNDLRKLGLYNMKPMVTSITRYYSDNKQKGGDTLNNKLRMINNSFKNENNDTIKSEDYAGPDYKTYLDSNGNFDLDSNYADVVDSLWAGANESFRIGGNNVDV